MHLHIQSISLNPTSVNLSLNGHQVVTALLTDCHNIVTTWLQPYGQINRCRIK